MKRTFKEWWSTIPPISTKGTTISHINSLNTKKTYDIGYPVTSLEQAQQCGGVKFVNVIPILPPYVLMCEGLRLKYHM
jgi:hypothetical protein